MHVCMHTLYMNAKPMLRLKQKGGGVIIKGKKKKKKGKLLKELAHPLSSLKERCWGGHKSSLFFLFSIAYA